MDFNQCVINAVNEIGELTLSLGAKYGPEALLIALARNTAYGMRTLDEETRRVMLKNIERFAWDTREEHRESRDNIKPPSDGLMFVEVLTAEDEIKHLKRQHDRYRAALEQCRAVMVPAHALYPSASFQLVIQLLHELLGHQSATRENFGYVEGADNTVAMALYEEYLRRPKEPM